QHPDLDRPEATAAGEDEGGARRGCHNSPPGKTWTVTTGIAAIVTCNSSDRAFGLDLIEAARCTTISALDDRVAVRNESIPARAGRGRTARLCVRERRSPTRSARWLPDRAPVHARGACRSGVAGAGTPGTLVAARPHLVRQSVQPESRIGGGWMLL